MSDKHICQVALCAHNAEQLRTWYRPAPKLKHLDWRPCDIGYSMIGIFARDFDKVVGRMMASSDQPLPEPVGPPGERRVCIQDPEGNWVEILERDPITLIEGADPCVVRPELLSATRYMRLSVPDLAESRGSFVRAMGLTGVEYQSHDPKPWPAGYRICDQGFMNIAFGYRDTAGFDREFAHARRNGMSPNGKPVDIGLFRVMYVNDQQGAGGDQHGKQH